MSGVRAELAVHAPGGCPVAELSKDAEGALTEVTWSTERNGEVTEQFQAPDAELDAEPVFDYASERVYQLTRDAEATCLCEIIHEHETPLTDVFARDGTLHVTVHVDEVERLRTLVRNLQDQFGSVSIEYLVEGRREGTDESDVVTVDRGLLTDRQREVLQTAHEMGYFDYPRESNATTVAESLDIEPSTFSEHLAATQSKLLGELIGERDATGR
jgi:predicted DNA binding protein